MASSPAEPARVGPLAATWRLLSARRFGAVRGLAPKACEFATSYAVTGAVSGHAVKLAILLSAALGL